MNTNLIKDEWHVYDPFVPKSMKTWTSVLTSYEEVPSGFKRSLPDPGPTFPYTLLIPQETTPPFAQRNPMLLSMYDDRIDILEAVEGVVKAMSFPFETVMYLEHGRILLNSWLKLSDQAHDTTITFNTVDEHLFRPVIARVRQAVALGLSPQDSEGRHQSELAKLEFLRTANFKYMYYGRESLRTGETIKSIIYQPEICVKTETTGQFKTAVLREYLTSHLVILTDKELILIQEGEPLRPEEWQLYGGVFIYVPASKIKAVTFNPGTVMESCMMQITLSDEVRLYAEFTLDNPALEPFKKAFPNVA